MLVIDIKEVRQADLILTGSSKFSSLSSATKILLSSFCNPDLQPSAATYFSSKYTTICLPLRPTILAPFTVCTVDYSLGQSGPAVESDKLPS